MTLKKKLLLIDCGNTYLKWCFSDAGMLTKQKKIKHKDLSVLEAYKNLIDEQSNHCGSVVLVSVLGKNFSAGAKKISEDAGLAFLEMHSHNNTAGMSPAYTKPENLGNDRWVAMIGAMAIMTLSNKTTNNTDVCIVIDSGTATTIDAIDRTGKHLGGVIFPGLELSLTSLSTNTELLPNLNTSKLFIDENGFSTSTEQAIKSGCLLALAGAIDGICNKMQTRLNTSSLHVKRLLCGGSAKTLLPYLNGDYEHHEDLIMLGLQKAKEISFND